MNKTVGPGSYEPENLRTVRSVVEWRRDKVKRSKWLKIKKFARVGPGAYDPVSH